MDAETLLSFYKPPKLEDITWGDGSNDQVTYGACDDRDGGVKLYECAGKIGRVVNGGGDILLVDVPFDNGIKKTVRLILDQDVGKVEQGTTLRIPEIGGAVGVQRSLIVGMVAHTLFPVNAPQEAEGTTP